MVIVNYIYRTTLAVLIILTALINKGIYFLGRSVDIIYRSLLKKYKTILSKRWTRDIYSRSENNICAVVTYKDHVEIGFNDDEESPVIKLTRENFQEVLDYMSGLNKKN